MTHLEAIQNYIEPYEVSDGKLELLLERQGLQPSDTHDAINDYRTIGKAVVAALMSLLSLKKEKDNGSELDYDLDGLKATIRHWQDELGEEELKPKNRDITPYW